MLPSIFETCIPRDKILSGELSVDLFAAKLRLVVEGKAPTVYQDARSFFANTLSTIIYCSYNFCPTGLSASIVFLNSSKAASFSDEGDSCLILSIHSLSFFSLG